MIDKMFLLLLIVLSFDGSGIGKTVANWGSGSTSGGGGGGGGGGIRGPLHSKHKGSSFTAIFNVKSFGAQANGHMDDTRGYLKATTHLSRYGSSAGWVEFGWVEGLTLTGGGIFDGQGATAWPYNKCTTNSSCNLLPTNAKNFKGSGINIFAPANSPNTDGIHIERSSSVYFSRSLIGTGDDCISIGQGNSQVTVTSISCGPGHGISVGSLGRYPNEGDVRGLVVRDCNMTGTTNGIRIKTWPNSPGQSAATNMTFENIVMNNVTNPIIIDQAYCPFASCTSLAPSRVKLSDINFKNIRGTSSSAVAVTLECSKGIPCQNIYLEDVHLDLMLSGNKQATSSCRNVRVKYIGTQIPPPCVFN
ncbi:pectin lyase-like superfamily protein [Actinidia rufa]|uniref:Pectin lyase-like superfamily protein n=1 Tax=Actinidia rufa TaxID=165716 RepID=A0A7J0FQD8_9ERIC|nr:pectin lyase-like superfamily protein [Actinidia rufa]